MDMDMGMKVVIVGEGYSVQEILYSYLAARLTPPANQMVSPALSDLQVPLLRDRA